MLDFDLMVKNILWEAGATGTDETTDGSEQAEQKGLYGFFVTGSPKPYVTLQSLWKTSFKLYQFPSESDLNQICFGVISSLPRVTKDPDKFPNFESVFPLIDLTALLYEQNFKGRTNPLPAATEATLKKFLQNIQKQITNSKNNLKPLDYFPIHPWVQTLKSEFLNTSKDELGKIRLEALDPKLSIYQAIYSILAIRKKVVSLKLPASLKNLSADGIINKILLEPWTIVSGTFSINDERMRAVYDEVTVQQMVNLSLTCYKLYNQQVSANIQNDITDTSYTSQRYAQFMGAKGAVPFQWLAKGQTPSILESFNDIVDALGSQYLIETEETRTKEDVKAALRKRYQTELILKAALASSAANKSSKFKGSLDVKPKAFETKPGMGTFIYNISKIKEASSTFRIDEATELLNQLKSFANYIKTKEGVNWVGVANAAGQIAQGLNLGVKNMGT